MGALVFLVGLGSIASDLKPFFLNQKSASLFFQAKFDFVRKCSLEFPMKILFSLKVRRPLGFEGFLYSAQQQ